jgi:hypothetical protein
VCLVCIKPWVQCTPPNNEYQATGILAFEVIFIKVNIKSYKNTSVFFFWFFYHFSLFKILNPYSRRRLFLWYKILPVFLQVVKRCVMNNSLLTFIKCHHYQIINFYRSLSVSGFILIHSFIFHFGFNKQVISKN